MPAIWWANSSRSSTLSPGFPPGPILSTFINPRHQQHLASIVSAALSAVDARRATMRALEALAESLRDETHIRVVAAGKAAVGMARAAADVLGERIVAGV